MQTVRNRVADILGIDLPIVQAPMNYIAGHALAAAVSAAGGMGVLGPNAGKVQGEEISMRERTLREFSRIREVTDKPVGINVVVQFFVNLGLTIANIALGIWNALGACAQNIGIAFSNVISGVQAWFYNLLSTALTVVAGICEALNKLPFVEFDYSGITNAASDYAAKAAEASGNIQDFVSVGDAFNEGMSTFDTWQDGWVGDAFNAGANWGDGVASGISDAVGGLFDMDLGAATDYGASGLGTGGYGDFAMDDLLGNTGQTAANTGAAADALSTSTEELEYLRDIAERDAINRFTTAEVRIDMTGMTNRIEGGADLDGVISTLTDGFTEALLTAAEGVHA